MYCHCWFVGSTVSMMSARDATTLSCGKPSLTVSTVFQSVSYHSVIVGLWIGTQDFFCIFVSPLRRKGDT